MSQTIKETKVGIHVLVVIAVISLLVGTGASLGLDRFPGSQIFKRLGEVAPSERPGGTVRGSSEFVLLAKKLKPVVVNISTTQVSEEVQLLPSPFGGDDPFSDFWKRFFGGPLPRGRSVRHDVRPICATRQTSSLLHDTSDAGSSM